MSLLDVQYKYIYTECLKKRKENIWNFDFALWKELKSAEWHNENNQSHFQILRFLYIIRQMRIVFIYRCNFAEKYTDFVKYRRDVVHSSSVGTTSTWAFYNTLYILNAVRLIT